MAQTVGFNDIKNQQIQQSEQNTQKPQAQPKGTGFVNLSRVIGANQGNKLGQTVGGGVQNTANQARTGLQTAQQGFQQQTQQDLNQAQSNRQQTLQNVMQDPTQVGDTQYNQFDIYRQGNYGGPAGLKNDVQLQGQAQEAEQLGGLVGSEGGRAALLQRYAAKNKPYTTGQTALDQVILGQSAQPQLKAARRATVGLGNEATRGIQGAEQQARDLGKQFGEQTSADVDASTNTANQNVDSEFQREKDLWLKLNNIRGRGGLGFDSTTPFELNEDEAKQLGLQQGDSLTRSTWDALNGGFNNLSDINKYNTASAQDYARQEALARLGGKAYSDTDYAGHESDADKFKQGFTVKDRGALQAASAKDLDAVNSTTNTLRSLVPSAGDINPQDVGSIRAAAQQGWNEANNAATELQQRFGGTMDQNRARIRQLEGDIAANPMNKQAQDEYNSLQAQNNNYQAQIEQQQRRRASIEQARDAILNQMQDLGIGRSVSIKQKEQA